MEKSFYSAVITYPEKVTFYFNTDGVGYLAKDQ
jgi:hypothetical protein